MATTSRAEAAHPANEHTGTRISCLSPQLRFQPHWKVRLRGCRPWMGGRKLLAMMPAKLARKSPIGVSERLIGEFPLDVGKTCWEVTCRATGESHWREGADGPC